MAGRVKIAQEVVGLILVFLGMALAFLLDVSASWRPVWSTSQGPKVLGRLDDHLGSGAQQAKRLTPEEREEDPDPVEPWPPL
jgi:hypothetical protein